MELDNEGNALISLRITFDLHKNFRSILDPDVPTFIDFVQKMYSRLNIIVQETFGGASSVSVESKGLDPLIEAQQQVARNQNFIRQKMESLQGKVDDELIEAQKLQASYLETFNKLDAQNQAYLLPPKKGGNNGGSGGGSDTSIRKSINSFKVLTECPLIVMLIFQLHPRCINQHVPSLTPLMIPSLNIVAPQVHSFFPSPSLLLI
jgi:transformation/transcription domain-associated protein